MDCIIGLNTDLHRHKLSGVNCMQLLKPKTCSTWCVHIGSEVGAWYILWFMYNYSPIAINYIANGLLLEPRSTSHLCHPWQSNKLGHKYIHACLTLISIEHIHEYIISAMNLTFRKEQDMNLCRWFAVYLSLRFYNMPCEHSSVKIYVFKSHAHKNVKHQFRMSFVPCPSEYFWVSGVLWW